MDIWCTLVGRQNLAEMFKKICLGTGNVGTMSYVGDSLRYDVSLNWFASLFIYYVFIIGSIIDCRMIYLIHENKRLHDCSVS